jgi:mersacidin/lichenicidin family type 2 lantibiotic
MKLDIIRAWKDEAYRRSLSQEQQAQLPANPAGELELSDAELQSVHGANGGTNYNSFSVACTQSVAGSCVSFGCQSHNYNSFSAICTQSAAAVCLSFGGKCPSH